MWMIRKRRDPTPSEWCRGGIWSCLPLKKEPRSIALIQSNLDSADAHERDNRGIDRSELLGASPLMACDLMVPSSLHELSAIVIALPHQLL